MSARLPENFSVWNFSHTYEIEAIPVADFIPLSQLLDRCEANNKSLATREEVDAILGCDLESDTYIIVIEQHAEGIDLYVADVRGCHERPTLFRVGRFPGVEVMLPSAAGYVVCKKKDH